MATLYSVEEQKFIVNQLDRMMYELTPWEIGFVSSIKGLLTQGKTLTAAQQKKLSEIWDAH